MKIEQAKLEYNEFTFGHTWTSGVIKKLEVTYWEDGSEDDVRIYFNNGIVLDVDYSYYTVLKDLMKKKQYIHFGYDLQTIKNDTRPKEKNKKTS